MEQERASIEQNKARTREYQSKLTQLSNIEQVRDLCITQAGASIALRAALQDLRTAEGLLVALQTEQSRLDRCSRELVTVRGHNSNREIEYRELTTRAEVRDNFFISHIPLQLFAMGAFQQLQRQLSNAREKFLRLQHTSAERREASNKKMEDLKERFTQVEKQRSGMLSQHDLLRKDIEQIETEVRSRLVDTA